MAKTATTELNFAALFASHLEPEVIEFTLGGSKEKSSVKMRPMNADKMARYKDSVTRFSVREGKDGEEDEMIFDPDTADADVALLLGTIEQMTLFFEKPDGQGGTVSEQCLFPAQPAARMNLFKEMIPELRAYLVKECKRVNGLGVSPLDQD